MLSVCGRRRARISAIVTASLSFELEQYAARVRPELHAHFGLDENHMVYASIALGHPDPREPANALCFKATTPSGMSDPD